MYTPAQRVALSEAKDFCALLKEAGLDPARDLRYADWSSVSFRNADLSGCDFTGARLINCNFTNALISKARLDSIEIGNGSWDSDHGSTDLTAAADWHKLARSIKADKPSTLDDRHLQPGVYFRDTPASPPLRVVADPLTGTHLGVAVAAVSLNHQGPASKEHPSIRWDAALALRLAGVHFTSLLLGRLAAMAVAPEGPAASALKGLRLLTGHDHTLLTPLQWEAIFVRDEARHDWHRAKPDWIIGLLSDGHFRYQWLCDESGRPALYDTHSRPRPLTAPLSPWFSASLLQATGFRPVRHMRYESSLSQNPPLP